MQKYKKKWKYNYGLMTKKTLPVLGSVLLSYQDSNLDKQNQNLMCYHYTIGQCKVRVWDGVLSMRCLNITVFFLSKAGAKVRLFFEVAKFIFYLAEKERYRGLMEYGVRLE